MPMDVEETSSLSPSLSLSLSFLSRGSTVEVSSDEDGLNGAWFVATVIHPPPSISISSPNHHQTHRNRNNNNNLVYVEYHNLLSSEDDASSRRLREYANVSYVRPSPPPLPDTNNNPSDYFQLNDLVDAFYRDAWWTGIITSVVDASNFLVSFQNPPHQIQFHLSHLRVHRKWVAGKWVQPHKQRTAGLMFTVGKKVEVSFERESLHDVWFPATILKNLGNNTFLVEYQQPGIGDEPILHKVRVDYLHIRPSPPHLRDTNFVLLERVDAYYEFGWWSGIITKELADNRYNVFFKHTQKEMEFICSRVRPHMEWKGGKWFNTSQGDTDGRITRSWMDAQATPSIARQSTVATSMMKRTKQINLDSNDNNSKRLTDEIMLDDPSKKVNRPSVDQSDSEVSVINDQAFGKTENLSHGKKVRSKREKGIELKTPTRDSSRKRGRLVNELRSLNALGEGGKGDYVETRSQEIVEKDVTKDLGLPVVMGLQCIGMTISKGKELEQLSSERIPNVAQGDLKQPLAVVDNKEGEVAPKRKRGRPPKLQAIIPKETPVAVAVSVVEDAQSKEVELLEEKQGVGGKQEQKNTSNAAVMDKLPNDDLNVRKKYSSTKGKRGKRRTISINTESLAQDSEEDAASAAASKEKADEQQLDKNSAARNPRGKSVSDDQTLSRWFEGEVHGPGPGEEEEGEGSDRGCLEIVTSCDKMDGENKLPFVRSSPLWQTIESMEALRKVPPQKPHFRPLLEGGVKESAREGLAIGCMVTFCSVVDKTFGFRFDVDPKSAIEDCMETLVEMETHGFDVEAIRDRLSRLLLIKEKQEELEERLKGVREKIEEHNKNIMGEEEEIGEIDRQISELQERRSQLLLLLLNKEKINSETGAMKAAIDQQIREVRAEFDELAAQALCLQH